MSQLIVNKKAWLIKTFPGIKRQVTRRDKL